MANMNLKIVLDRLKLQDKDVLNVYVMGSRLWGTVTNSSDWDILIVHQCSDAPGHKTAHCGDIDASLLHCDEYRKRLSEHHFLEIVTVWMPLEYVWKEKFDPKTVFNLDPQVLLASVFTESERDWTMAQKVIRKAEQMRGAKIIVHCFRELLLSTQIVEQGRIVDWRVATHYYDEMKEYMWSNDSSSSGETMWSHYDTVYGVEWQRLRTALQQAVNLLAAPRARQPRGNHR